MLKKRTFFLIILLIIFLCILPLYYFLLPPKVIEVSQVVVKADSELDIKDVPKIIMNFDKPVQRKSIEPFITPEVPGEWVYENPLLGNHLYMALAFVPEAKMDPNVQYTIDLGNVKGFFIMDISRDYSFSFTPKIDMVSAMPDEKITIIDIKPDWQNDNLSCEAASLKMALSGKGVYVSEDDIMQKIGYDKVDHQGEIWGNPYEHFVGDINGKMCITGYGVYWDPVAIAADYWRPAESFSNGNIEKIIKEINKGNPVIVWGTLPVKNLTDCSWYTPDGKYVKAYKEDHVRLLIGFMGSNQNPTKIILNDPLAGRLFWDTDFFMSNWKAFDYSGVVIK